MRSPSRTFVAHVASGGFTLVEVLVAMLLLTGAVAAVLQVIVLTARTTIDARDMSYAGWMATQKLHQLLSDDLSSLAPSSPDAWRRTEAGHIEYLDSAGRVLGAIGLPPGSALYLRRWSVTAVAGDASGGVLVQVAAGRLHRQLATGMPRDARPTEVARVVGVRTGTVP
jgi:prepilin-type N-terminal cleavage/methylation domain-containing protein